MDESVRGDPERRDFGLRGPHRHQDVDRVGVVRFRPVGRRGIRLTDGMAVIDAEQLLTRRVHRTECRKLFARVDDIAGRGLRMHVHAADHAGDRAVAPSEESADLARRFLAGMCGDVVPERLTEAERVGYRAPPAIAGMTMTSLPSGTAAPVPPFTRASSSPMYTFT